jgi:hypothetical protein
VPLTELTIRGRRCVTLAGLAEVYEVSAAFVVEAYDLGLLGEGYAVEPRAARDPGLQAIAVAAEMLDRMAVLCRWHRLAGLDPAGVALLLDRFLDDELP